MSQVFLWAAVALALMLLFPLYRMVKGPTIYDRLVGAAMMGTKTIVLLLLMGFATGRADMYVDISIGYGLALVIGHLVTAKYLEQTAARGDSVCLEADHDAPAKTRDSSSEGDAQDRSSDE